MKRTSHKVCVDCGGPKAWGAHHLVNRCKPCGQSFYAQMRAANAAIALAVSRGELPRAKTLTCTDCGGPGFDWDHRDYSKPLEVQAVCRACNFKRGPALYVRPQYAAVQQEGATA